MSCGWGAADYFHNMPITLWCANALSYTEERSPIFIGLRMYKRQAEIKAEFYDEMINVAEAKFKVPIRKKAGAKQ